MDEAEIAHEYEEAERQAAIAKRRPTLQSTGYCWYCNEAVTGSLLFCGIDCSREHDRERAIRQAQGR